MLDQRFEPKEAEARIYAKWEADGCFKPSGEGEAYAIVIPPPNVTGVLHMGHALNNTLQDVLIRYNRMLGKNVLWQAGTDHAGIATQMVVERNMAAAGGNESRASLGREKFVERVWDWREESGGKIIEQLKRLGASCDWSRTRFTMGRNPFKDASEPDTNDGAQMEEAVRKVFVQLYNEGLIYRDKRLVNWDPHFQTAISDLEVEMKEVQGHYWHLRYPLADGVTYEHPVFDEEGEPAGTETRGYLVVATSRPETMLGDTCVAVHPDDERYTSLHGKFIDLPIVGRRIPIVADEYPDPEKGSGAVKITPAHDFNDYEVGKRHGHTPLNILTSVAAIVDGAEAEAAGIPQYLQGKDRFEARDMVLADFEDAELMHEIEKLKIEQPFGDRSGVVIEPWLTDQWYVDAKTLAGPAMEAVNSGKTRFVPGNWKKTYDNWMNDIQPWCISRQLWWGHRIPVWYGPSLDSEGDLDYDQSGLIVFVAETENEISELAKAHYETLGYEKRIKFFATREECELIDNYEVGNELGLFQDPDVLDTWFSSGLWPFSTQGWPEKTDDLATFYPGNVLVTAFDIIFFWVARMMMQGIHFMGEVPFKDVYIHALVLDEKGQKMSKSKGNTVDPLEIMEEYGADALRFFMASMAAQGRNVRLSTQRIEGYRNFSTKLWNAARFAEMNECAATADFDASALTQSVNQWIAGETARAADEIAAAIEAYRFNDAAAAGYQFVWSVFCDWYLELIKPLLNGEDEAAKAETRATCGWALDQILTMLHPFMPFVTEELYQKIAARDGHLMLQSWPKIEGVSYPGADEELDWVIRLITEVRSVKSALGVAPARMVPAALAGLSDQNKARLEAHRGVIERLARLEAIAVSDAPPEGFVGSVLDEATICMDVAGEIDLATEKARLAKDQGKLEKEIKGLESKLGNEKFISRAPPEVVEEQRDRLVEAKAALEKTSGLLARLGELG